MQLLDPLKNYPSISFLVSFNFYLLLNSIEAMYNKGFHFEIHDLLTQFVAAMDDVVISRYNKNREEQEQLKVRYVNAPVQRVLLDIINKSQNITVPVIAVNVSSIDRDENRVFNKIEGFYNPVTRGADKVTAHVPMPVPINLGVTVTILTNYQSDMDQILSNFVPYSNPYLIISWKIPVEFGLSDISEIRSEVLWSGSISVEQPIELQPSDKPRFQSTTNFTIKGWLFPAAAKDFFKNIYFIDSNFHLTNRIKLDYDLYPTLANDLTEVDTISISAAPLLTNIYLLNGNSSYPVELVGNSTVIKTVNQPMSFNILGEMLQYTTSILISTNQTSMYENLTSFDFQYYPTVGGFLLPNSYFTIMSENVLHLTLPVLSAEGDFNIVVVNPVGWKDANSINTFLTYISA